MLAGLTSSRPGCSQITGCIIEHVAMESEVISSPTEVILKGRCM